MDSELYRWAWRTDNLAFLEKTLSVGYIIEKLDQAASVLFGHPQEVLAKQVASDSKVRRDIIEIQIADLMQTLPCAGLSR